MTIAFTDVHYRDGAAIAAAVVTRAFEDAVALEEVTAQLPDAAEYVPGQFYRRELPPLLRVLAQLAAPPACVVVDGHAWLARGRPGLGAHLHEALQRRVPVVGIAKNAFAGNDACLPVLRGQSRNPLYVSCCGLDLRETAAQVAAMAGEHRMPTILARVDALCRGRVIRM